MNSLLASRASRLMDNTVIASLHYRRLTLGNAGCAQLMRWLATLHAWLQRISKHATSDVGQLTAFRLTIPVFQLANVFFTRAYALGERRLLLLGLQGERPRISQPGIDLGDCGDRLVNVSQGMIRCDQVMKRSHAGK